MSDIKDLLGISVSSGRKLVSEVLKKHENILLVKDRLQNDKSACFYLTMEVEASEVMRMLPDSARWRLQSNNIDEQSFLAVIKEHPGISTNKLERALFKNGSWHSEVASMIKVLIKKDLIADIGNNRERRLYVQDGTYRSTIKLKIPLEVLVSTVKAHEGCSIRELHHLIRPSYSVASMYSRLKAIEEIHMVKVVNTETDFEYWRLFSSKRMVNLPENEVTLESLK